MTKLSAIFLVTHSSPGGVQELWADLAEGFRTRGIDARLMALYPHGQAGHAARSSLPWEYVVPQKPRSIRGIFGLLRSLVRLVGNQAPRTVFTAMPAANVLAPVAARLAGASTHVVISHHSQVGTYNRLLNLVDHWTGSLRSVRSIVSVSRTVSDSLVDKPRVYRRKRMTIHNALPPRIERHLQALASAEDRSMARKRKVVAIGRLSPQKNYPVLLRAAALMPDVEVHIIGSGPDEEALKSLAADLRVTDRVLFVGHRSREEALTLLADADVFVQPSLFEGHSLALIEAAKLHLPLVVSDVPSQVEGVTAPDGTTCGIVVDAHDQRQLALEIQRLIDDPSRYRAWSELSARLGASATFETMLEAYQRLGDGS
ncbi:glycosyltransferase [Microvirga sesbaniae]|uniref:glycosyltransferase n=1 Tax=Microvirga sesbaniae TaxID=681392 RepID=UPI0021C762EF|nr:glycosyltransferase [Microvirga sp. HBU67692]